MSRATRTAVDLSDQPDLVVIYLGMRVRTLRGMRTLRRIGKEIEHAAAAKPDGAAPTRDAVVLAGPAAPGGCANTGATSTPSSAGPARSRTSKVAVGATARASSVLAALNRTP
jgi:hypothetical protein